MPAACTFVGLLVGVVTFLRWRHAILPTVPAFAASLVAFLVAQPILAAALGDVIRR